MRIKPNVLWIRDIFEIRILDGQWQQIRATAQTNGVSYCWIVRLCVFRLLSAKFSRFEMLNNLSSSRRNYIFPQERLHRHLLCLYGEDAAVIKMAAIKEGITVSAFVRMAVDLYLPEMGVLSDGELLEAGLKFTKSIESGKIPHRISPDMENHIKNDVRYLFEHREFRPLRRFTRYWRL